VSWLTSESNQVFDLEAILCYFKTGGWVVMYVQSKEQYLDMRRKQTANDIVVWLNGDSQTVTFLSDCGTSTFTFELTGSIVKRRD
jgi:hypothetical protein